MNLKEILKTIDENFEGDSKCFDFGNLLLKIDVQSHTIHGHLNGDDFLFNSLDYARVLRFIFGISESDDVILENETQVDKILENETQVYK